MTETSNTMINWDQQFYNKPLIAEVLSGDRPTKDLAFGFWLDLEPEGYSYWDHVRSADELHPAARKKLENILTKRF